jgi:hypothetical protein
VSVSGSDPPVIVSLFDPSAEFTTDIADVYPNKEVSLVHSRDQPLPHFDKQIMTKVLLLYNSSLARWLTGCVRQLWTDSAR